MVAYRSCSVFTFAVDAEIIGIAHKPRPFLGQKFVHLMQHNVRQQGAEGAALRYTFATFGQLAADLNRCSKPKAYQAQRGGAFYLAINELKQNGMVNFVKEAFQVDFHNMLVSLVDVLLRLLNGLVGIALRAKSVAVSMKFRFKQWAYRLTYRLLKHSVHHRGHA